MHVPDLLFSCVALYLNYECIHSCVPFTMNQLKQLDSQLGSHRDSRLSIQDGADTPLMNITAQNSGLNMTAISLFRHTTCSMSVCIHDKDLLVSIL